MSGTSVSWAISFATSFLLTSNCVQAKKGYSKWPHARLTSHARAGFSGLTRDAKGHFWAVPERDHFLVRLEPRDRDLVEAQLIPIEGVPKGADLESIASAGEFFVAGTETMDGDRGHDDILIIEIRDKKAVVTRTIPLKYKSLGVEPVVNQGLEGVCVADGQIVFALESVRKVRGQRVARVGRIGIDGQGLEAYDLPLTSAKGKLSGLSCNAREGSIDVYAIERHFGVARIIRFSLGTGALESEVVADLSTKLDPLPNFEGLFVAPKGSIALLTDNQGLHAKGPTYLFLGELGRGFFTTRKRAP